MLDERIADTFIGQKYGWNRVSDADPRRLREDRRTHLAIVINGGADSEQAAKLVRAIDEFFYSYGDLVELFA